MHTKPVRAWYDEFKTWVADKRHVKHTQNVHKVHANHTQKIMINLLFEKCL